MTHPHFVYVPVPVDRLVDVYKFLGCTEAPDTNQAPMPPSPVEPALAAFDPNLLARAYRESPDTMKRVFDCLADNAGKAIGLAEVAGAVGRNTKQMSGVLGAFGRRWLNRYHKGVDTKWPFSAWWDFEGNTMVYRMSHEAAEVIKGIR